MLHCSNCSAITISIPTTGKSPLGCKVGDWQSCNYYKQSATTGKSPRLQSGGGDRKSCSAITISNPPRQENPPPRLQSGGTDNRAITISNPHDRKIPPPRLQSGGGQKIVQCNYYKQSPTTGKSPPPRLQSGGTDNRAITISNPTTGKSPPPGCRVGGTENRAVQLL